MSETPLLEVRGLDVHYGQTQALRDVSLAVADGTATAVLGSNGAGKSTLARAISGLVAASAGDVWFDGQRITRMAPHRIRRLGLVHLPEGRGVFPRLTVMENLRMAVRPVGRSDRAQAIEGAIEMFPVLGERRTQLAGSLSGGEQQMLSLARAMAVKPRMLIGDELSLGLAPRVVESVFEALERARDAGVAILLIEQFVQRALAFADECAIMRRGSLAWQGHASDAAAEVLDNYLGAA